VIDSIIASRKPRLTVARLPTTNFVSSAGLVRFAAFFPLPFSGLSFAALCLTSGVCFFFIVFSFSFSELIGEDRS
jgi:hypothetical protein